MATFTSTAPVRANSGQALKDWVQLTHDAMIAIGCIQTADTGQIVLEDISEPSSGANYSIGYRIYELNDSLSSEHPIFIKIVFAPRRITNQTAEYAAPGGYVQVGFSTDGAGNISGTLLVNSYTYDAYTGSSSSPGYHPNPLTMACKMDGYLCLGVGIGCAWQTIYVSATAHFIIIKRTLDQNGNYDGKGCVALFTSGSCHLSNKGEINYQWGGKDPSYLGGIQTSPLVLPRVPSIDGLIQACAIDLTGWNYTRIDTDIVGLIESSALRGSNITLSADGIEEKNYLVIPMYTGSGDYTQRGLSADVDTRYRNLGAIAVRFE